MKIKWIKTSDQLPADCDYILAYYEDNRDYPLKRMKYRWKGWWSEEGDDESEYLAPDYWILERNLIPNENNKDNQ